MEETIYCAYCYRPCSTRYLQEDYRRRYYSKNFSEAKKYVHNDCYEFDKHKQTWQAIMNAKPPYGKV